MSAPATVPDFLDLCRKSGVVEEARLTAVAGSRPETPMAAAKALMRVGVLTKFQATQLLAGKYKGLKFDRLKLLDRIGSGGMGTVFLCEHTGLRKQVAVKVLPPDQAGDEGTRERFFREARAAAALDHPNIVRVHDANSTGGVHYIVMEYVEGRDLQTHLNKYGPIPYEKACTYVAQAALGLQHAAEKGIVHRDIKPANLLVDKDGVVKVLDMGLARFRADEKDNLTAKYDRGAILGTADYMAPEQIIASSQVDGRADIYALGVTLYALINGKPPFSGNNTQKMAGHTSIKATSLTQIRREVPKGLSAVVDKMMAKSPDERYQTPAEVVAALGPWLDADTIPMAASLTGKMFPESAIRRPKSKAKGIAVIAAVAVSALVFGGLGMWALSGGDDSGPNQAVAQNPPARKSSPPQTTNPNPPAQPKTDRPKAVAKAPTRALYEIDFGKQAFMARFERKELVKLDGGYPKGWGALSWREGDTSEIGRVDHLGSGAVSIRTLEGQGSAELFTSLDSPPFRLTAGRSYTVAVDYAVAGPKPANMEFRFNRERPPVQTKRALPPTGGQWQTADYTFTAPDHDNFQIYFLQWGGVDPSALLVRSFRIQEAAPAVASKGSEVFRLDLANTPAATVRARGGVTEGGGRLPGKINVYAWDRQSTAEGAVESVAGQKALTLKTVTGKPAAMLFGPYLTFAADREYRVEVEYRLPGRDAAQLKIDELMLRGRDVRQLQPTAGEWVTAEVTVRTGTEGGAGKIEFSYGGADVLAIRKLIVADLGPAPSAAQVLHRSDFEAAAPVRFLRRGKSTVESNGSLPPGLSAHPWSDDTLMECAIEPAGTGKALALRNLEGKESAMLFLPGVAVRAGTTYWVSVEYQSTNDIAGTVRVACEPAKARDVGQLVTTRGEWRTVHSSFQLLEGEGVHARIEIHARGRGADKGLRIRSIVITEAGAPAVAKAVLYRFSPADAKPFAAATDNNTVLRTAAVPDLPVDWSANSWKAGDSGEIGVADIAGRRGLYVQNAEGSVSTQVWTGEVAELKAGVAYEIKLTYFGEAQAKGHLDVRRNGQHDSRYGSLALKPTDGKWQEASFSLTPPETGPLVLFVQPFVGGPDTRFAIHSIEVVGEAAPTPTQTARPYRLNLAGAKAFARRYKGDAIVESQGDGDLPAGWAGKTVTAETLGDVFVDTVGGVPTLGIRNHEGPPAVRLFTGDVLRTTAGKSYSVKITYQTEASGRGWLAVGIGGSEVRKLDLVTAAGNWRDAEVTVTAPAAGGLTLTVGGESVGSDASVYIKGVEVRELP
jgi:eukaryotic-like serine/threonine-protein kinase